MLECLIRLCGIFTIYRVLHKVFFHFLSSLLWQSWYKVWHLITFNPFNTLVFNLLALELNKLLNFMVAFTESNLLGIGQIKSKKLLKALKLFHTCTSTAFKMFRHILNNNVYLTLYLRLPNYNFMVIDNIFYMLYKFSCNIFFIQEVVMLCGSSFS